MPAKTIMVQGTASHAGKSILVAALCRIFNQDGYKVAPFKSQNMALNSYVTAKGGEMGRAQVVQAEAAGIEPDVCMNPILLKPTGNSSSQVIVMGRPMDNYTAQNYHAKVTSELWKTVQDALERLRSEYGIIVIEGAGSPAEVNLEDTEIVNMRVAREADAPVLLVTDIDRGGALAAVVGTLELLQPKDRDRIKGIIINKFRGDVRIFQPAIDFLEKKTGIPVCGVIPYFNDLRIQDEDSVVMEEKNTSSSCDERKVQVCVIRLPRLSNFTDFDAFETDDDVELRYVKSVNELTNPDLIIIPGSKNTIEDLLYLKETGLAGHIVKKAKTGVPVIGICGGFQMLGSELMDPEGTESNIEHISGLGLLDMATIFEKDKITSQVEAAAYSRSKFLNVYEDKLTGYEIHMGRTELKENLEHAFEIHKRTGVNVLIKDGAVSADGNVWGTYMHGIFDNDGFRRHLIKILKRDKGIIEGEKDQVLSTSERRQRDYDRLAELVRSNLDMNLVYSIIGF